MSERIDGRGSDEMRRLSFQLDIAPHASGSVLTSFGNTQVICSAMLESNVPRWMKAQNVSGGWLTAEYNMLPYSCLDRKARDISRGRLDGRSSEIQRLIGRSLRAVVDLKELGPRTLWIDCDVLRADGGTRTASITGASIAVEMAFRRLIAAGILVVSPMKQMAAAVSSGVWEDGCILDLNYPEDRDATVDFNYVMSEDLNLIEMQGTGEESTFTEVEMLEMLRLGKKGIAEIFQEQRKVLNGFDPSADEEALARIVAANF